MFSGAMVHVMANTEKIVDRFNNVIIPEITGNTYDWVGTNYRYLCENNSFDLFLDYPSGRSKKIWTMEVKRQPTVQDEQDYYKAVESALYKCILRLIDENNNDDEEEME